MWYLAELLFAEAPKAGRVAVEMRKPSYHGAGWRRINPGLRRWWESRFPAADSGLQPRRGV